MPSKLPFCLTSRVCIFRLVRRDLLPFSLTSSVCIFRLVRRDLLPFNLTVLARDSSSTGEIMETSVPVLVSFFVNMYSIGRVAMSEESLRKTQGLKGRYGHSTD